MCVTNFPVPGCGSIKTDLLLCWVPLCLRNWLLEVNISVFLFLWIGFTDLLSGHRGHREPLAAPVAPLPPQPRHRTPFQPPVPSVLAPVRCQALPSQVCSCPCWTLVLASVTPCAGARGCPQLPQPAPLPHGGAETGPGWCFHAVLTVVKQAVVPALPLHCKSISFTEKKKDILLVVPCFFNSAISCFF